MQRSASSSERGSGHPSPSGRRAGETPAGPRAASSSVPASGQEQLIQGIEEDARAEADKILAGAGQAAANRRQAAERQAASILEEAGRKAAEQKEAVARNIASTTTVQTRRVALRLREEAIRAVEGQVRERLRSLVGEPAYRQVLLGWITEAALGLNVGEAVVSVSAPERRWLDAALLREAERQVRELGGPEVALAPSDRPAPAEQGVLLTSADGRLAFNNQVSTRLRRSQGAIRRIIHDELFGEEKQV